MALTPSGEVAVFVDDNQFGSGQSQDKCGPEAVSMAFHSVAPGAHNPYTSADIHAMAHDDYQKFIGPDVTSDQNGTSNETLYAMLAEHGLHYQSGPADISWTKAQLAKGWIVIIGIVESSVIDTALAKNPYNWNTAGLTHVICATGAGKDGEILTRDTANIDTNGIVRPGPRHYDTSHLRLISATAVEPSWISNPAPVVPWAETPQGRQAAATWASTTIGAITPGGNTLAEIGIFPAGKMPYYSTGIAQAWQNEYKAGTNWGAPTSYEFSEVNGVPLTDWNGQPIIQQNFAGGRCERSKAGVNKFYPWGK